MESQGHLAPDGYRLLLATHRKDPETALKSNPSERHETADRMRRAVMHATHHRPNSSPSHGIGI